MLIYEVNLAVDADVREAFALWLWEHVEELEGFHGFAGATVYERRAADEGRQEDDRALLTVHYRIETRAHLDDYLNNHAPRMRRDGERRFGGRFEAARRVLTPAPRPRAGSARSAAGDDDDL